MATFTETELILEWEYNEEYQYAFERIREYNASEQGGEKLKADERHDLLEQIAKMQEIDLRRYKMAMIGKFYVELKGALEEVIDARLAIRGASAILGAATKPDDVAREVVSRRAVDITRKLDKNERELAKKIAEYLSGLAR
ncbi:MAG: hypothetical protein LBB23_03350 [Rickettsiales bacterium]|jgi:hypothetical protein|nr:hypothetical protein [Rickettsiales bacterium]